MHSSYVALYDNYRRQWVQPYKTKFGLQSEYLALLNATVPEVVEDSPCPDCGSPMHLKVGRYGRYYRCRRYKKHGCPGACSAQLNGAYTGKPVHSSIRTLRRQILLLKEQKTEEGIPVADLLAERFAGVDLRDSNAEHCKETIAFLATLVAQSCIDQILGDTFDPLGEPMKDQYVVYQALGKEHQAGPYTAQEVRGHRDDIAGYEGVSNARIVCEADLNKKPPRPGKKPLKTALDMILEEDDAPGTDSRIP